MIAFVQFADLCKKICLKFTSDPVRIIPSVYFIGDGGVPLEVVSGSVSPNDFLKRIENVKEVRMHWQKYFEIKISSVANNCKL